MGPWVSDLGQIHVFRLESGDDLLGGLVRSIGRVGVRQGVIMAGIGSLASYHLHVVDEPQWPPVDTFLRAEGGLDLLSVQGYVVDGRIHAHIVVSDAQGAKGGHLEEGCRVFTFAVVTVGELEGVDLTGVDQLRMPEGNC
jgi:predicted DNA-binding protein with PD1-like motif